ncbi:MAG: hypothetical protein OZSIB_0498 [Candidatus Ozemobacter sibiricus]|uniref:Uncharacterized protein n=1 Tax=Candidatus Ozemobacter sibiricus TaxID=2268124 RepID=A0A367ZM67_9BACT|nr:MAG: hypothetical protein OZSIB_0498 [Candidatus Ozemobacter sibiricus]
MSQTQAQARPTTINQELLCWSVLVVIELMVIFVLTSGFVGFLALVAIVPIIWWPVRDALNWPVPPPKPGEGGPAAPPPAPPSS